MLGQGKELAAIDFEDLIGGPLMAVVKAQAKAAITTTNFIQSFAFKSGANNVQELQTVSFDFSQVLDSSLASSLTNLTTIKVPLLTIIPIPFIRVDSMTIDFNCNLHSTHKTTFSNDFTFNTNASASGSYMGFGVGFSASISDRNTYQSDSTVDDTYSMHVNVHAVQDQLPGGLGQVLGIFSSIIQSQASLIQTIVSKQVEKRTEDAQARLDQTSPAPPTPLLPRT